MVHEMKPIVRRGLCLLVILCCAAVWMLTSGMSQRQRRGITCQGKGTLDVTVTDSLERRFVTREDIGLWLEKEYRAYAGLPLDSVDLGRIEQLITGHSAVRECQAWLTDDGILHVSLSQRQPVVRFQDGSNGYYADASGFLFPLQARGSVQVPVIDGKLPLKVPRGFKGAPEDPVQKAWLDQIIGLVNYMDGSVWQRNISQISVNSRGDLVMVPREGSERFLFGAPTRVQEKFDLMSTYYESVVPVHDPGWYHSVDVRFRGQLICRR